MVKTLMVSDVKNFRKLEEGLRSLNYDIDLIVCTGDLLSHTWTIHQYPLLKGMEELQKSLKMMKEHASKVVFLPGGTDLRPDLSEEICRKLDVVQLTEEISETIYSSAVFEGRGYSIISWGPGAGIGGIRGYFQEMEMFKNGLVPCSSIHLNGSYHELINPFYSGLIFQESFEKKIKEAKSSKRIVISHMPPYMGNDIEPLCVNKTSNDNLDVVEVSKVKNVEYMCPTHTGDIFFRKLLNNYCKRCSNFFVYSVFFGHIEEQKGESKLEDTRLVNLGSFGKNNLYKVDL